MDLTLPLLTAPLWGDGAWPSAAALLPRTRRFHQLARALYAMIAAGGVGITLVRTRDVEPRTVPVLVVAFIALSALAVLHSRGQTVGLVAAAAACLLATALPVTVQSAMQGHVLYLLTWYAATIVPSWAALAFAVASSVVTVSVRWAQGGTADGVTAVGELVLLGCFAVAAAFIRRAGVNAVIGADASLEARQRQELSERLDEADATAVSRARQALHDEVLGVLVAMSSETTDYPQLLEQMGHVADRLDGRLASADPKYTAIHTLLEDVTGRCGLQVRLQMGDRAEHWPSLTDVQAGVVHRAVGEALRNTVRHAGVGGASVTANYRDGWFRVVVHDAGRGFDPASAGNWGRRYSITEPVESIGGHVRMVAAPGRGTTVTIDWPSTPTSVRPGGLKAAYTMTIAAAPAAVSPVLDVLAWVCVVEAFLAICYSWGHPSATAQLLVGLPTLVVTLLIIRRLKHQPLTAAQMTAASMTLGSALAVGLALTGPGALTRYESWLVGFTSTSLMAVAFFSDWTVTLLFTAPSLTALVWATLSDTTLVSPTDAGGAYVALLLSTAGAWLCGGALRLASRQIASEARRFAEVSGTAYRLRADQAALRTLTSFTRTSVTPWLRTIAADPARLPAVDTRTRAAALARQVRDELYLGEILDDALRYRIDQCRRDGIHIAFEAKDGSPVPAAAIPLRLLDRVLDGYDGISLIRVAVPTTADPTWSLSIVPPAAGYTVMQRLLPALTTIEHEVSQGTFAVTLKGDHR